MFSNLWTIWNWDRDIKDKEIEIIKNDDHIEIKKNPISKVKKKLTVHFCPGVRVILIPSRKEHEAAGLIRVLWWSKEGY